jgi:DNA-binding NarL/FixJ family response regulator
MPRAITNKKKLGTIRRLSGCEKEIVQLVAQGYRNKEVAQKLSISEQTVENHL